MQFQVVFINYYNGSFLADGTVVNVYPLGVAPINANLVTTGVVGETPSPTGNGQVTLYNLTIGNAYQVMFSGTNVPTGTHYMTVINNTLYTVPIYYNTNVNSTVFTFTTQNISMVSVGSLITIPVVSNAQFADNEYILVSGDAGAFLALITEANQTAQLTCVVTSILNGAVNDIISANAFVNLFFPGAFQGTPGTSGPPGIGVTTTDPVSGAFLIPTTPGSAYMLPVEQSAGYPVGTYVVLSDGVYSVVGQITGNDGNNVLVFTYLGLVNGAPGDTIAAGATLSFSGPQGIQGIQGIQGEDGEQGDQGIQGIQGPGSTLTVATCIFPQLPGVVELTVADTTAFPLSAYIVASDNTNVLYGQVVGVTVLGTTPASGILNVQSISAVGLELNTGATVSFSGPQGIPGYGIQGDKGDPGNDGPVGPGITFTNSPTLIQPIGTNIRITVASVTAFPKYAYLLVSDGVYSFVGSVVAQDTVNNVLTVKILSILNASLGSTIQSGATVSFSGPPGPVGTVPEIGVEGTVQYRRMLFSPGSSYFNSGQGLTTATTLGSISINLPGVLENGLAPNFDVVVELDCSIATNQLVTNPLAYVGIGTSQLPLTGTATQIFAGYISPPQTAPVIPNSACIADTPLNISYPNVPGTPGRAFFSGTYSSNSNPSFSVLVTAMQPNTTFYVSANLKITAYPLYD